MTADQVKARAVVETFLTQVGKRLDAWTDELSLYADGLGLDSLEVAELSALLEDELGTDPFSSGSGMPETIGEILAFYAGDLSSDPGTAVESAAAIPG